MHQILSLAQKARPSPGSPPSTRIGAMKMKELCVCERGEGGCLSAPPSLPSTLLRLLLSSPPAVPSRPRRARSRGGRCAPFSGPSLLITPFVTSAVSLLHRKRASSSRKRNSRRLSQTITDVQMCPSGFLYRRRSCVPSQQLR